MIRSEAMWEQIIPDLNREDSEFIALHLYYTLKTFEYTGGSIIELPVTKKWYNYVYDKASSLVHHFLKEVEYEKMDRMLHMIAKDFRDDCFIIALSDCRDFVKECEHFYWLIALSGVLAGVRCTLQDKEYIEYLLQIDDTINRTLFELGDSNNE